ncbi:MAG TPA: 4Fe-4S single cluster domain-containing protein [Gemmata sp.]
MNIRLGHRLSDLRPTLHNGPGWRVSFWVQGCRHRCTERCLNPHYLDPAAGFEYAVGEVFEAIRAAAGAAPEPAEGVTVLGGEPFEQGAAVAAVLEPLRRAGLSAMVYSGRVHEGLRADPDPGIAALLAQTDLLVDGPFLPAFYSESVPWRGSTNQRLLCLTERYSPERLAGAAAEQGKGFSLRVGGGHLSASGLQTPTGTAAVARAFGLPVLDPVLAAQEAPV